MSERDAERLGVDPKERHLWVRLDGAKANLALIDGEARWFKKVSVTIANGEEVGVLVPVNPADTSTTETADDRAERVREVILEQVAAAWSAWNRDQSRLPLSNQPPVLRRAAGVVRGLDETPAKSLIFLPRDVCGACGGWGSNALKSLARGFAGVSGACFPPYPPSAHAREALRLRRPWRGSAPRAARTLVGGL